MLANVNSNLLTLVVVSVHQYPLDQIVAVLVSSNVDERDAGTVWSSRGDDTKVAIQKLQAANLQTLLNNFGSKLIDAVIVRVRKDVVDDATLVGGRPMLAEMLNAPVAKLTMSDEVDVCNDFLDCRALKHVSMAVDSMHITHLFFLNAVFKDVLDHETASLTERNFMPHAAKSFVDLDHDLRWLPAPA